MAKAASFGDIPSLVLVFLHIVAADTGDQMEDPFLLPFGPKHGDEFATREGCSLPLDLERTFNIGNTTVKSAYVCLDGVITFKLPDQLFDQSESFDFDAIDYPIVAPFLAPHRFETVFLDYRCVYTQEENSFYGNQEWCELLNGTPELLVPNLDHENNKELAEQNMKIVKAMHQKDLSQRERNELFNKFVKSQMDTDDFEALTYFGAATTKYVNLANTITKRQIEKGHKDLEVLSKLIRVRERNANFTASWAFVTTWYKFLTECSGITYPLPVSFQIAIACGNDASSEASSRRCFVINTYFELPERICLSSPKIYCGFAADYTYSVPEQCLASNFSTERLVEHSNIGVKGVWLYELDQNGPSAIKYTEDLSASSNNETLKRIHDFSTFDEDEPFLLHFGSKHGDNFANINQRFSMPDVLSEPLKVSNQQSTSIRVSREGFLSLSPQSSTSAYGISRQYGNGIYLAPLLFQPLYSLKEIFLDYTCLLDGNDFHIYFNYFKSCFSMYSPSHPESYFIPMTYAESTNFLEAAAQWNKMPHNEASSFINITDDDEKSLVVLGQDTKYVNLAGNVLKRETTNPNDLDLITSFINRGVPDFEAVSAYVVTWYKIGTISRRDWFNSFQCIVACGVDKCFIVFDYHEKDWKASYTSMPRIAIDNSIYEFPSADLLHGGNYGEEGRFVIHLNKNSVDIISNFDMNVDLVSKQSNASVPFLLPFGPKYGDTFTSMSYIENVGPCSYSQFLSHPLILLTTEVKKVTVCYLGSIQLIKEADDNLSDLKIGEISIYEMVNSYSRYSSNVLKDDNLLDYLCMEAYESGKDSLEFQYLQTKGEFCPLIPNIWLVPENDYDIGKQYWMNADNLKDVSELNSRRKWRNGTHFDIHEDDNISKLNFGVNSTKYVNLANNKYQRESLDPADLSNITSFIQLNTSFYNFQANWSLTSTWYKMWFGELGYGSYQTIVTCGNSSIINETNYVCLVIFDYFETPKGDSRNPSSQFAAGRIYAGKWKGNTNVGQSSCLTKFSSSYSNHSRTFNPTNCYYASTYSVFITNYNQK